MLRRSLSAWALGVKPPTAKGGSRNTAEESFIRAALEYTYETHRPDVPKSASDIQSERLIARAYDRFVAAGDVEFDARLERQVQRSNAVMASLPPALRDEAAMLNSEQPPLNFRRPTLTPPLPKYEPAFGLDVPALRARVPEYPPVQRPDEQFAEDPTYPMADPHEVKDLNRQVEEDLNSVISAARSAQPQTGNYGEAMEAVVALQERAARRQDLILELCENDDLRERYESDATLRDEMLAERGLVPLEVDDTEAPSGDGRVPAPEEPLHYAQEPKMLHPKAS